METGWARYESSPIFKEIAGSGLVLGWKRIN